ncbi:MAG: restriction endonuclease [Curvibacter sp.]
MKFKLNERSLFAVLLRSPWWISLLIAVMMSVVAFALLPQEYALVVTLGTFPFLVIAAIAAWRQLRAPSAASIDAALDRAGAMNWRDFAGAVEAAYVRQGYKVTRVNGEAADLLIERAGQCSLLSCRRWKAVNHGVETLKALQAACEREGARGIYLCLAPVSEAAAIFAKQQGLQLVVGRALGLMLAASAA